MSTILAVQSSNCNLSLVSVIGRAEIGAVTPLMTSFVLKNKVHLRSQLQQFFFALDQEI